MQSCRAADKMTYCGQVPFMQQTISSVILVAPGKLKRISRTDMLCVLKMFKTARGGKAVADGSSR